MFDFIIFGLISFCVSILLFKPCVFFAKKFRIIDQPDYRKIHNKPTPRTGGIMIFLSIISVYLFMIFIGKFKAEPQTYYFLLIICLGFLLGVIDDLINIKAKYKLIFQILIGVIASFVGFRINNIFLFNQIVNIGPFSYFLTTIWLIVFMNAINLIDGMDGLAAGVSSISFIFSLVLALMKNNYFVATVSVITLGAILGFMVFNFYPAKIFMGDSGSYLIGLIYSLLALSGVAKTSMAVMMLIPLVILIIPLMDLIYIFVRRLKRKMSPFKADKNHIHHRLQSIGFTVVQINLLIYFACTILGVISVLMALTNGRYGLLFFLLLFSIVFLGFMVIRMLEFKGKN